MRDTLLVVCTKYMHKAGSFQQSAPGSFQQEGLWLDSTKETYDPNPVCSGQAPRLSESLS